MEQGREDATDHVKHDEAHMPHCVFDVVAEHPDKQHIADEVDPAPVQEHVSDERQALRHDERPVGEERRPSARVFEQLCGDNGERHHVVLGKRNDPSRLEDRVDGDIEGDQPHGHILEADLLERVGVVEGNEHGVTADRINGSCRAPTSRRTCLCRWHSARQQTKSPTAD